MRLVRRTIPSAIRLRIVPVRPALRIKNTNELRDIPQIVGLDCTRLTDPDTMTSTL